MCISNGNQADMHNILFENMSVEFQSDTMPQVLQREDLQEYDNDGKTMPPYAIRNAITQYEIRNKSKDGLLRKASEKFGDVHDIIYRNINIYTDIDSLKPIILMESPICEKKMRNFKLENIYINGKKAESLDDFETQFKNVESVTIE